jgi:hypothetical protein
MRDTREPKKLLESFITHLNIVASTLKIIHHYHRFGLLDFPPPAMVMGRDLILLGLNPTKEFSILLDHAYEAQMRGIFNSHEEGIEWCKKNLVTVS